MISLSGAVYVVVYICVAGLIFWMLNFLLDTIAPPEPFHKVGKVVLLVLAILVVIGILLNLVGVGGGIFRA